jgi:hypothetical protein
LFSQPSRRAVRTRCASAPGANSSLYRPIHVTCLFALSRRTRLIRFPAIQSLPTSFASAESARTASFRAATASAVFAFGPQGSAAGGRKRTSRSGDQIT